ncbi:hypothetical protein EDB82DRAFT_485714 [Fusarium venenatum]|uniref:uncharacterized protein n=1 Tax=Fusarium venenatum TaxID=56646 RepID=UPI001DB19E30|nr:hypothetical protein EDB82DRAFT_485714 [Fusarium venenatum]
MISLSVLSLWNVTQTYVIQRTPYIQPANIFISESHPYNYRPNLSGRCFFSPKKQKRRAKFYTTSSRWVDMKTISRLPSPRVSNLLLIKAFLFRRFTASQCRCFFRYRR